MGEGISGAASQAGRSGQDHRGQGGSLSLAKHTVGWSAYLNGMRVDYDRFEQELHQIGEHLSAQS